MRSPIFIDCEMVACGTHTFRMEGVKELYDVIKDRVEIKLSLRQQPYGDWEFEVKDPNGYIVVFSELID
jgi:uncharacterized glyoxalase superfamily protein PhnB